ncbi:MAG: hypothetical protein AAFW84_29215 [Cyanobacteria bacterium J06635_15]
MENSLIGNILLFIVIVLGPTLLLALTVWFTALSILEFKNWLIRAYRLKRTPCSRCLYYTGCKELACAVHPCKVLTKAAIACPDFFPADPAEPRAGKIANKN